MVAMNSLSDVLTAYVEYAEDLSPNTERRIKHDLNRWSRYGGNSQFREISTDHFIQFRKHCRENQLSPATIESTVDTINTLMMFCLAPNGSRYGLGLIDQVPFLGRRIRVTPDPKDCCSIEDLSAIYSQCHMTQWPGTGWLSCEYWKKWLVFAYNTALRLSDIMKITWENINLKEKQLVVKCQKTQKLQAFPLNDISLATLSAIPRTSGRIFGLSSCYFLARRELRRMCEAAGIKVITPQSIRRCSATQYELVREGAGDMILGHVKQNVTFTSYVKIPRLLREAAEKLQQPEAFLTC